MSKSHYHFFYSSKFIKIRLCESRVEKNDKGTLQLEWKLFMNTNFIEREICPVCFCDETTAIQTKDYCERQIRDYLINFYSPQGKVELEFLDGAQYILQECSSCELIYQRFIPNNELTFRLYEKWIDPKVVYEMYERSYPLSYYTYYASIVEAIINHFGKNPGQLKVLDFSMGWGNWARMAKAFGCEVYGTELSPTRIAHAEKHGIQILSSDKIWAYKFDFINADQIFEHIPEPAKTLDYLKQSLKSQRIIRICVPDGINIKEKLKKQNWTADKDSPDSLNEVAPLEHINCFNQRSLLTLGQRAGLRSINICYSPRSESLIKDSPIEQLYLTLRSIKWLIKSIFTKNKVSTYQTDIYFKKN